MKRSAPNEWPDVVLNHICLLRYFHQECDSIVFYANKSSSSVTTCLRKNTALLLNFSPSKFFICSMKYTLLFFGFNHFITHGYIVNIKNAQIIVPYLLKWILYDLFIFGDYNVPGNCTLLFAADFFPKITY